MSFMQQQITRKQKWYQIDTIREGIVVYPADMFSAEWVAEEWDRPIEDVEIIEGYGARLSAPGYMDCTEWSVFNTPAEAQAYLDEYYPDDEEDESDE